MGGRTDPPWFFANNSRKTQQIAAKLTVPSRWSIWHILWKFKLMSCQVIKLWRHMSGHVRTKSADFAICRTRVRVLASQRMSMHSMRIYWCLWMSRHQMQLTQGQGHARSCFIGASSRSIKPLQLAIFLRAWASERLFRAKWMPDSISAPKNTLYMIHHVSRSSEVIWGHWPRLNIPWGEQLL